jgi:hypothetical protein
MPTGGAVGPRRAVTPGGIATRVDGQRLLIRHDALDNQLTHEAA